MQSYSEGKLVIGPWKAHSQQKNEEIVQRPIPLGYQEVPISSELTRRLFDESQVRLGRPEDRNVHKDTGKVASPDVLFNRTVLMFAALSCKNSQIVSSLEKTFDLYVLNAKDPTFFYEWLFRYAHVADLMIVDLDTFGGDKSSFKRFVRIAREACDELPLVVVSEEFVVDDFACNWSDDWDISLRKPISQTSLCRAIGVTCEITLQGR
jgi:hypothetical protein